MLDNKMEVNTMAFVITEECLSCGSCAEQCPAEAIFEGEAHFEINPDTCMDCGACADSCPNDAIHPAD